MATLVDCSDIQAQQVGKSQQGKPENDWPHQKADVFSDFSATCPAMVPSEPSHGFL